MRDSIETLKTKFSVYILYSEKLPFLIHQGAAAEKNGVELVKWSETIR